MQKQEALNIISLIERKRYALRYAQVVAEWLMETSDPQGATSGRGVALEEWATHDYALLTSPELGHALDVLESATDIDQDTQAQVRVLARERKRKIAVDSELIGEQARLQNEAYEAWLAAKKASNWSLFAPALQQIVELTKRINAQIDPDTDPYDVSLDEFEEGSSQAFYDSFFEEVKTCVVPLVKKIKEMPALSKACVEGTFVHDAQEALGFDLLNMERLDWNRLTFGYTEHPFTESIDCNHVFLCGHIHEDLLTSNLFTILHEGGHALYHQGVAQKFALTCLHGSPSLGIDESQSRFYENYLGRSWAFAPRLLSLLATHFPREFDGVVPEELYQAINAVDTKNPLRTEADELTYPLHVLVRYEIEKSLMDGSLAVDEVPARWAELCQNYLGLEIKNDRDGALQDVHWSQGALGYFPTYALGSAIGAQLLNTLHAVLELDKIIESGDLSPLNEWLGANIWSLGKSESTATIIEQTCGVPFSVSYYCDYLTQKYTALYGL